MAPAIGPEEPRAVSVAAAARRLAISRSAAYELVASGKLPAARLGPRMTRIPVQAIDDLLERLSGAPARSPR